jgi:hypothetical protein
MIIVKEDFSHLHDIAHKNFLLPPSTSLSSSSSLMLKRNSSSVMAVKGTASQFSFLQEHFFYFNVSNEGFSESLVHGK